MSGRRREVLTRHLPWLWCGCQRRGGACAHVGRRPSKHAYSVRAWRSARARILAEQGGRCAICRTGAPLGPQRRWHMDHDHATGALRGVLCAACNTALGLAGDSPERLRAMAAYLEQHVEAEEEGRAQAGAEEQGGPPPQAVAGRLRLGGPAASRPTGSAEVAGRRPGGGDGQGPGRPGNQRGDAAHANQAALEGPARLGAGRAPVAGRAANPGLREAHEQPIRTERGE